jgi:hypothetical protein
MECSMEELLVALSDKLWKGHRSGDLDLLVVDRMAALLGKERWAMFEELDEVFETIADGGDDRIRRSRGL